MRTFKIKDLESGDIAIWSLFDVLEEINRDHSNEFENYTEANWRYGWNEWVVEEGYYELIDLLP